MPIDPLSILFKEAVHIGSGAIQKALAGDGLSRSLENEIVTWARTLPPGFEVDPAALFPEQESGFVGAQSPVQAQLHEKQLPGSEAWFQALMARWEWVAKNIPDSQPIFHRTRAEVDPHIRKLAAALEKRCRLDDELFKLALLQRTDRLLEIASSGAAPASEDVDKRGDLHLPVFFALRQKAYSTAETLLNTILTKFPNSRKAHYNLAIAISRQLESGAEDTHGTRLSAAAAHFQKALDLGVLKLLITDELIADPVEFVRNDVDLAFLYKSVPRLLDNLRDAGLNLHPVMGVKALGGGGGGCFAPGTTVRLPDGKRIKIENVTVGTPVACWTERLGLMTGVVVARGVSHQRMVALNNLIRLSASQPVQLADGKWSPASLLKAGDSLQTSTADPLYLASVSEDSAGPVHWLEVKPWHTYLAGGIVAHNKLCYPRKD